MSASVHLALVKSIGTGSRNRSRMYKVSDVYKRQTPDTRGEIRDGRRIAYLRKQIEQARLALAHGVPLIGYCTWSAFDLASTQNGYQKRYGLIYVCLLYTS